MLILGELSLLLFYGSCHSSLNIFYEHHLILRADLFDLILVEFCSFFFYLIKLYFKFTKLSLELPNLVKKIFTLRIFVLQLFLMRFFSILFAFFDRFDLFGKPLNFNLMLLHHTIEFLFVLFVLFFLSLFTFLQHVISLSNHHLCLIILLFKRIRFCIFRLKFSF